MAAKRYTGLMKYLKLGAAALDGGLASLPPGFLWFMARQMRFEKATELGGRLFINTTYTPLRSRAFRSALGYFSNSSRKKTSPFSVYFALTNRCHLKCWYCSNPGSGREDLPFDTLARAIGQAQDLGAACIGFTGGEPLLRADLESLVSGVDDRSYTLLFTSGHGLDAARAASLKKAGLTAVVVSLDSHIPEEHNANRTSASAHAEAVAALKSSIAAGLYTAISMVITKDILYSGRIYDFIKFAGGLGVHEIRILRPKPCGKVIKGNFELLEERDVARFVDLQYEINRDPDLPVIMSLPHIGTINNFGCSAGRTHVYVSADGDVCPCDFVPIGFGNISSEPFAGIYARMLESFPSPAHGCVSQLVYREIDSISGGTLPLKDPSAIANVMASMGRRPVPKLYRKLGWD
ncbi:MAG: radical SAM domain-containing protein [Elusimicrobia bacterium]|nr:MAG: radical SAM domain-containing protein [Elusimicrobiota bacterium]KAF0151756.1 MAG: radical SAM domain-containing protein [Elusimicrobiota bacterium]